MAKREALRRRIESSAARSGWCVSARRVPDWAVWQRDEIGSNAGESVTGRKSQAPSRRLCLAPVHVFDLPSMAPLHHVGSYM